MSIASFFRRRRECKAMKERLAAARVFLWSNEDVMDADDARDLRAALAARDAAALDALLERLNPPKSLPFLREMLDVCVVALSVAMAFRAYYFEPFNIPTGSMQPTLYGIHSTPAAPGSGTVWDRQPLRFFKWAVTGRRYVEIQAPCSGILGVERRNDGMVDVLVYPVRNYQTGILAPGLDEQHAARGHAVVAGEIPADAVATTNRSFAAFDSGGRPVSHVKTVPTGLVGPDGGLSAVCGARVSKGQTLWAGTIEPGDFLFVNRMVWNFSRPERGDVMVFNTTGLANLMQKTHYIKRLTGLPGETLSIDEPALVVDGKRVEEPRRIGQIARRESFMEGAPAYAGYVNERGSRLATPSDSVVLGPDEYFACGDNQLNSWDSRYWGPVPGKKLVGRASFVFWPFASPRWGFIE